MVDHLTRDDFSALGVHLHWAHLSGSLTAEAPSNLSHVHVFGDCSIGAFTYTDVRCELHNCDIGRYCSIGPDVLIGPGEHPLDFLTTHPIASDETGAIAGLDQDARYHAICSTGASRPLKDQPRTEIVADVWIGAKAIIRRGVRIGAGAVIGCGAVVTRDVPPFAVMAGVPARLLKFRFEGALAQRILRSKWWERDLSVLPRRDFADVEGLIELIERYNPPPANFERHYIVAL